MCLLCKILFFKKCRPKGSNNIFILPTDQPSFFCHLPRRPKINLVLPKGSCVVVWKCEDYITRVEKQLSPKNVNRDVKLKELRYFIIYHKKACQLRKDLFVTQNS